MSFMMKKFAQAPRRGRSRPLGRQSVSCEILECRQLLSTGMLPGRMLSIMPVSAFGGWESPWVDMALRTQSSGAQAQVVSNLAGSGRVLDVAFGSGGAQSQAVSGGSTGSTAGATLTSPSMITLPGGGEFALAGAPEPSVSWGKYRLNSWFEPDQPVGEHSTSRRQCRFRRRPGCVGKQR